jgi:predicted ATP-dependent protease
MEDPGRQAERLEEDQLGWRCAPDWLDFRTTNDLSACRDFHGQDDAVAALRLGIRLRAPGYNVFVEGVSGTGRTSTARRVLREESRQGPEPSDLCYVVNFDDSGSPAPLRLPAGKGKDLRRAMARGADHLRQGIAALRASRTHRRRRETVARSYRERQSSLLSSFQDAVAEDGFALVEVSLGSTRRQELAPMVGDQPVSLEELDQHIGEGNIDEETVERMRRRHPVHLARLSHVTSEVRQIGRELDQALQETDREAGRPLVRETLEEVRSVVGLEAGEHAPLDRHLDQVERFLLEVVPFLFAAGERIPTDPDEARVQDPLAALSVHVLVDRSDHDGRPVVEEPEPTPANLLGSIETRPGGQPGGEPLSGLRAGALHRADGGFLLLNALELAQAEGGWAALRRALRTGEVGFHLGTAGQEGPPSMTPRRVPVEVTVVLVGPPRVREHFVEGDPEFERLFKVVALFEERIPLDRESASSYACFLGKVVADEGLAPLERGAVERILASMIRVAGGQGKISTRYRLLADLAREANCFAVEGGADVVRREHVERALAARRERSALISSRILESIKNGLLHLELEGRRAGQVNALAVVETSLERFGYPVRLTATSSVGRSGIIDIEREAELAGEIHTKASLILAGFLRSRFAQQMPLTLTASVCFEQSYGGVEGDSASAAELAALLSSLAGVPARQDLAVTGAVDQRGQLLAVGGVNEKVEGFWAACRARGLTGTQGVVLPTASRAALQLRPEVVEDVAAGRFHVYAARDIAALMELLTGMAFGDLDPDEPWLEGTLGALVEARLRELAVILRGYPGAP